MKKYIRTFILAATICSLPLLQGCLVAAIGAGVGAAKYGSAKQKEAYGNYRTEMEKVNLEREKSGLEPKGILTYDEWRKGDQ